MFVGLLIVALLLGVVVYIGSHTKLEKKELPVTKKTTKSAPPKPEHKGQIDLSMMSVNYICNEANATKVVFER